jgi:hypothetical protein
MFRFNPYNFTITIDEAIQPPGIPADFVQIRNASGQNVWVPPGTKAVNNVSRLVAPGGGPGSSTSFSALNSYQQGNIANRVKQNIQQNQQANVQMTPSQRQAMMAAALAKRARQNKGTGSPPVYPPPPLPPPPPPAPPAPPPPATTSTGISARRQKADTVVGGLASAFSSIGGSANRRPDRFGDPGRLIQGLYDAGKVAYDAMKTQGTPGSAATATSPAVAATPGRFDPRGGSRMARAGVGAIAGTMVGGPVGGLIGAGIGALTGRRKPIPEERYYRVYKMISQHDHR